MRTTGPPRTSARVLHVITRLDRGGSATNTLLTAAGLPPVFKQAVVYGRTREFPRLAVGLRGTLEMAEIPELVREISPVKDLAALLKIYRFIRRGRFDLVHTHTSKAGLLGRLAARLARVPRVVHTPHGHVLTGYAGARLTRVFVLLERWAASFTDRIIGLTDQEVRDYLEQRIGRPEQYVSIPSGIEVDGFEQAPADPDGVRSALGLSASALVIGSVGRLEPIKGHRYLLEAFHAVAARFPELHLVLVGEGELLPELRDLARRSGVVGRVWFLGWREDVPRLLPAFDLFVFPSLNEGQGRALVEAMAAGLPIVASRAGGIPEVLGEGDAGLLVEPGSAAALARGIETLVSDPGLRERLAKAARERARSYSVETMLRRIEALYRELLNLEDAPR